MNINATTSHNPFLPIKPTNSVIPDQAIQARDGSIKPGGTDNLSSLSPAIQERIAAMKSQASTTDQDATSGRFLTVDGMRAAWGESDSIYDLNGDDTVNVKDLLKLLAAGGTIAHAEAPLTLEGLLDVYGQSNPAYDLNEDGIVNVKDILQLFAQQGDGIAKGHSHHSASASETAKPGVTSPIEPSLDKPANTELTGKVPIEPSLDKPASTELTGKVPIEPFLNKPASTELTGKVPIEPSLDKPASTELTGKVPVDSPAQIPSKSTNPHSFRNVSELRDIAQAIFQRLMGAGFEFKPPANIHSLVDQLKLSTPQKQVIIDRLAERYPQGLGVNFVG